MDLVERQKVVDALLGITAMRNTIPLDSAIFNIKKLPSAQPEVLACGEGELSAQPEPQWIPCIEPPGTDRNVFIARGNENFISCCIGHYDHEAETWYEDRNWFAQILYDVLYWCEMPTLPEPWRGEEHEQSRK